MTGDVYKGVTVVGTSTESFSEGHPQGGRARKSNDKRTEVVRDQRSTRRSAQRADRVSSDDGSVLQAEVQRYG